jgi:hypothetical protein
MAVAATAMAALAAVPAAALAAPVAMAAALAAPAAALAVAAPAAAAPAAVVSWFCHLPAYHGNLSLDTHSSSCINAAVCIALMSQQPLLCAPV